MSLRRRLTLTMAVLLVVGLAVANVATYALLRSFLYGKVDDQIDASQQVEYDLLTYTHSHPQAHADLTTQLGRHINPNSYVIVLNHKGKILYSRPSGSASAPDPAPQLPAQLRVQSAPARHTFGRKHGTYHVTDPLTVVTSSKDPSAQYLLEAVAVPQGTLVNAISLNSTSATLSSLLRIEVGASAAIVLALCGIALWTVRRELRPLENMSVTADAIASGDLTRRIDDLTTDTEVARLGRALNRMLAQIEAAFNEKSASEAQLRQFVADASHELRTPLTSIRGYSELLGRGAFTDEQSRLKALGRVEEEAKRMGGLVDDLLLLARLDQGRPLLAETVDLRGLCEQAVEDARTVDPARHIEFLAPQDVVVVGDHDRLGQVAHNLIRNALAHTTGVVRVEVLRRQTTAELRVIDEGPGITDVEQQRVFDRFYRSDQQRTGEGTGLGLAIVRAIAEALGGSATVNSVPGRGSRFSVELPLAERDAAPTTRAQARASK